MRARMRTVFAALVALLILGLGRPAEAELAAVWALDDGTKVKATETSHALEAGNGIYDPAGPQITLFGARNEIVAFQVILEGGAAETANVRVRLDQVGPIQNSGVTGDPDAWFVGRRIEMFAQHYLNVTTRSHDLSWDPGSASEPAGLTGWIPDALVPLSDTDTVTVPAGENQGLWIDLYIPPGTAPGTYQGTLTVEINGTPCAMTGCMIPVGLEVLAATLPDEPTARTMLYFSGSEGDRDQMWSRYSSDPWGDSYAVVEAMRMRHYKLGRRHRITFFIGEKDAPDTDLQGRIEGTSFAAAAGYEGPGQGVGQDMYSIHTYGGTLSSGEANTWAGWFSAHGPQVEYFLYTMDEPGSGDFPTINQIALDAQPVPSFVTHEPTAGLEVDIYCAFAAAYDIAAAAQATSSGKRVWIYNGMRPFTGTFVIDDVAVSPRVNPWIQHKYEIPRWFYWESTYYNDFQGGRGQINVFSEPINFTNSWGDEMNGDGLLIYPGRDMLFPAEDRGFDGPMPSIRLKNWRRGVQDVEYLALAAAAGHQSLVDNVMDTLVPRALDEGGLAAGDAVPWEEDGEVWLAQRRRLADVLRGESIPDGGVADGGVADAGPTSDASVAGDSSVSPDGAVDPGDDNGGCDCRTGHGPGSPGPPLLLLLGLWFLCRRGAKRSSRQTG